MGSVLRRLLFFFQRNQFDRDLEDELRFHEEMKAHALADADGMSGDEAGGRAAADWQSAPAARTVARTVDVRDGRNVRAGRASRAAIDVARPGVHLHRPRHARARHRPQHRDFLRRLRRALAPAAVSQSRSPRHRLVSAADRDGPQDVLDLAAPDVRGAAPARHHARSSRGLLLDRRAAHRTRRAAAVARTRRESEFLRHAGRQSRARPRVPHRRRGARRRSQRDRQRSTVAHVAQRRSGDRRTVHHHRRPPPYRRRRAAAGLQLQAGGAPARRAAGRGHLSAQSLARRHRR